jgi:hypothetical protein
MHQHKVKQGTANAVHGMILKTGPYETKDVKSTPPFSPLFFRRDVNPQCRFCVVSGQSLNVLLLRLSLWSPGSYEF